jgi:hypothetical protein
MSEEKIPKGLEAIAVAANVLDPEAQWRNFVKKNGGSVPTENLAYRWTLWLATAPKKPKQGESGTLPGVESRERRRARELHESIREAQRLDPKKEIGIAACAKILENLDAIPRDPPRIERRPMTASEVEELERDHHDELTRSSDPFEDLGLE